MPRETLFVGAAVRRLRRGERLTQSVMASRLGISASYLNLIERNQRPVSTRVLMQLVAEFALDPLSLRGHDEAGGVDGLARRLADRRFADLGIDRTEIDEFLSVAPHIAAAFARLYDKAAAAHPLQDNALVATRRAVEHWRNHFADLDHAAEQLADELRLSRGDTLTALTEHLRGRHQLSVRVLPQDVMPSVSRRLDLHARQVQLSEMLSDASRRFQLAVQIARLEQQDAVNALVAGSDLERGSSARMLFERHLYAYFAAAVLMPYRRFLRAAQATGYDLSILQRRFGVSFEQLAHRLTTMQRVGERGLPFFMARVDNAGQFSKRFAGASGATFLDERLPGEDGSCPLWHLHRAFTRPGEWQVQRIDVDGASPNDWTTISRTVERPDRSGAVFSVAVGLETRFASELVQARPVSSTSLPKTLTGVGCRQCRRTACAQRSHPPSGVILLGEQMSQGLPFSFSAVGGEP